MEAQCREWRTHFRSERPDIGERGISQFFLLISQIEKTHAYARYLPVTDSGSSMRGNLRSFYRMALSTPPSINCHDFRDLSYCLRY
jgi:hypothetical protein